MNENFLNYLWSHQLVDINLMTTSGEKLTIVKTGQINRNSGPDFTNAQIRIGNTVWAGNIEVHIRSSDWYRHGHHTDHAYDNIILHVVYENDRQVVRLSNERVPTLELKGKFDANILLRYRTLIDSKKWIACENEIGRVGYFDLLLWFDRLMAERLETKAEQLGHELAHTDQDFAETFYRKLCRNFGFSTNADAFELLARTLPLKILIKHTDRLQQIEALLYGQSGLLQATFKDDYPRQLQKEYRFLAHKYNLVANDKKLMKFMRMRPANFPTIRISQFANILYKSSGIIHKLLSASRLTDVYALFRSQASPYWDDHFHFDRRTSTKRKKTLGPASVHLILINTVIPFMFVYGINKNDQQLKDKAISWIQELKPEHNAISGRFSRLGIKARTALQTQALLHLKSNYCDLKRCLDCHIGHQLLNHR